MAPKRAGGKDKQPKVHDQERKDISNMLKQAKNSSATAEQKTMLQLYQSYPRFDAKKKEILNKWRGDKTCSWVSSYAEVNTKSNEVEDKSVHGYGTMFTSKLSIKAILIMVIMFLLF